jgi:3-carboxy-cis,cis-muconate cycloisomerase
VIARAHARTPILGRTLLQGAVPTTFGLKAAGWAVALADGVAELEHVRDQVLAVSLGGPAGTLSGFGDCATVVEQAFAAELGLAAPLLPWHADRRRPARVAAALGLLAGQVGKLARDVTLLAQTEVGEAREGEPDPEHPRGGSSSMGHKRNPVAAVSALACAQRVPALVVTMLSSMVGEHERAAGAWQAEWETWGDLLRLTGSATAWARELLEGLEVDPAAMAANLARIDPSSSDEHVRAAAALVDRALHALSDDEEPA